MDITVNVVWLGPMANFEARIEEALRGESAGALSGTGIIGMMARVVGACATATGRLSGPEVNSKRQSTVKPVAVQCAHIVSAATTHTKQHHAPSRDSAAGGMMIDDGLLLLVT